MTDTVTTIEKNAELIRILFLISLAISDVGYENGKGEGDEFNEIWLSLDDDFEC